MEDNSVLNMQLEKEIEGSSDREKVDDNKVDECKMEGTVDGVEEVEPPNVGMVFPSQEEVRNYYNKYAQRDGFRVIRKSTKCGDDGKVKYFSLACARSGNVVNTAKNPLRLRQSQKTNCKAKINVIVGPDGQISVCRVILEHNHELNPGNVQGGRRRKNWGAQVKRGGEVNEQAGAALHENSHSIVVGEAGGHENLPSDSAMQKANSSNLNSDQHLQSPKTNHSGSKNMSNGLKRSSVPAISQNLATHRGQDALKRALAKRAVKLVKSGMVIGLGTGKVASFVIEELGKLIREGKLKDVVAVGTSYQSRVLARQFGVTTVDLNNVNNIDIAFDGVDEVDFNKNLLKGGGPAHTLQKVVDSIANECVILADHSKVVHRLGSSAFPVPVEVLPPALSPVLKRLVTLGGVPEVRSALTKDGPVFTDLGNMVIDVSFPNGLQNPAEIEKSINLIPGVVENGIVSGIATLVLVAVKDRGNVNVMDLEEFVRVVLGQRDASSTL